MKDSKHFVLMVIGLMAFGIAQGQEESFVRKWRSHKVLKHANIGIAVHDISTQDLTYGYNEGLSLTPASSLKLLTTLVALQELGDDFTYTTKLAYDGKIDRDGTLQGNLFIIGSGDPTLGSSRVPGTLAYTDLIKYIHKSIVDYGITCIDGMIIADESVFDSYPIAPSWQWNDLGNYYAGGAWGLNVNENEYSIYFDSNYKVGSLSKLLYTDPKVPDLVLENEVTVDSANTGDNAYVFGGPYDFKKRIVGTIPQSKKKFKIKGSIPDPPKFLARKIHQYLDVKGIKSSGYHVKMKARSMYKEQEVFTTIRSKNIKEIVKYANYFSINGYCESLLKTVGLVKKKKGSGGYGIRAIYEYLAKHKIDATALHLEDGSGLSARNMTSPEILSKFVAKYTKDNGIDIVKQVIPKAGASGTVRSLLNGRKAQGNVWVKSGSMERILSYSGICKAKSGKWVSFSLIINGYTGEYRDAKSRAEQMIDNIYKSN